MRRSGSEVPDALTSCHHHGDDRVEHRPDSRRNGGDGHLSGHVVHVVRSRGQAREDRGIADGRALVAVHGPTQDSPKTRG